MVVTKALAKNSAYSGNLYNCIEWAKTHAKKTGTPVAIARARPESRRYQVIAEVTAQGVRMLNAPLEVNAKRVERFYGE
ncbi:hypothetical protein [Gilvimarinus sp. DA14]|uniref:hypothetical protein n=1 Tax=Gilvimarinus sp. DA14 TaxID=2956798 RepID=UPI0020B6EF46|nr:hypothetical protein [Gilvimarinus sp. DA14]UTF60278.1 hypothetical protein NHM04_00350 [Gilvimarinus sp. DA14]